MTEAEVLTSAEREELRRKRRELSDALLAGRLEAALKLARAFMGDPARPVHLAARIIQPLDEELDLLWRSGRLARGKLHLAESLLLQVWTRVAPVVALTEEPKLKAVVAGPARETDPLGPRVIADLIALQGWRAYHLGPDVPPEVLVEFVDQTRPQLLYLHVGKPWLLHRAALVVERLTERLPDSARPRVMAGGQGFALASQAWERVGADMYAKDAEEAIWMLRGLPAR